MIQHSKCSFAEFPEGQVSTRPIETSKDSSISRISDMLPGFTRTLDAILSVVSGCYILASFILRTLLVTYSHVLENQVKISTLTIAKTLIYNIDCGWDN